ncbi:uncharacterized protein [Arachis hypogaea]|uniref:uncharacterized protein n=1 Tax=Arachis hypogaea TaxID=3818 RepID=UPI003B21D814
MKSFWNNLGYQGVGIVEANGHSGGIWVLCSNSNISVRVLDVVDQCISFEITMGNTSSYCSAVYANPHIHRRKELWGDLTRIANMIHGPWIVLGDFNDVLLQSEVRGGQFRLARAEQFAETLEDCGLFDMGAIGRRFTWYRKVKGGVQVAKKLDRAVINQDWRLMFPEAYTEVLARLHSDHCPLFTRCKMEKRAIKGHRPFRFQAAWMTHPLFRNVVDTAWNRGAPDVVKCLLEVQKDATSFNKKVFGNIFVKKRELERLLNDVQITLESREDQQLRIKEQVLHQELNDVLLQEELLWYQKSREQWVRCGDRNTKFFHLQTVIRRKRNKIHGLFLEDGSWATETTTLEMAANSFFQKLFSTREDIDLDAMGPFPCPSLSTEACQKLVEPVTSEEVKRAVMTMSSFKAPGPDGFQAIFYKEFWDSLSNDVCGLVKRAFEGEPLNAAIFDTLIVLIPKVEVPSSLREFRPISLCNVIYKIVTKVLVNRFRPFLSEIIGPLQGGFIPGRGTTENIIIAQEIMHFMRNTKSRKGTMAFKIDLEKAYDRVDWRFLEATLVRFGFPKATINLILNCVTSSSLAVLWNGNRLQNFNPKRGLRQGDPMSPYLFVLCMEMLACFISHRVSQGLWNPVAVSRNGPRLSHLMFADDLLLFCKASKAQVIEVMHCLDLFSRASGLKVNLHKSKAQCSKRVSERRKEVLSGVSNIRFCNDLGKYLGINIGHARASRKMAQEIIEKISRKLSSQETGKGLPLVRWEVAITPKKAGGLGIRDTSCANMALMGKLVWDCLNNSEKLWVQVLKHKYLRNQSGMNGNSKNSSSATWKNIVSAYEHLKEGLHWNIGDVHKSVWYDEWTPFEKFKFTMWLSLHDALPTETFRFKRHLASSDMCKRCNKAQETMEHCLRDCERSKAIWYMLDPSILDSTAGTALEEWFRKALANNEASFGAGLWWVWRHRCNDIFNTDNPWTDHKVVALARITAKNLQLYRNRSNAFRSLRNCLCWEPPLPPQRESEQGRSSSLEDMISAVGGLLRFAGGVLLIVEVAFFEEAFIARGRLGCFFLFAPRVLVTSRGGCLWGGDAERHYELALPGVDERVCYTNLDSPTVLDWMWVYEAMFTRLGVRLPFSPFVQQLLSRCFVAPSQLHPNSWAAIRTFELVCEFLELPASVNVFLFLFLCTLPAKEGKQKKGYMLFRAQLHRRVFGLYEDSFHGFKEGYFKVRPARGHHPFWLTLEGERQFLTY